MRSTKILMANSDRTEAESLRAVIDHEYDLVIATDPSELTDIGEDYGLVVLDANFSESQGLDVLMGITSKRYVPILMITPPQDHKCAIESIRLGAFNYLVKESGYEHLLSPAIYEALRRYNEHEEMEATIIELRNEVAALKEIAGNSATILDDDIKEAQPKSMSPETQRKEALNEIVKLLKSGELNLPVYSQTSAEFRKLLAEGAGLPEIAGLLKQDMGISSKLISVANSANYRGVSEVSKLEDAISRLGTEMTKNYVEIITNRALYITSDPKYKPILLDIWTHSLACAHAANFLAERANLTSPDEIFSMALLHDIGKLLLVVVISELDARGTVKDFDADNLAVLLDAHHGQFGARLLRRWKLPDEFVRVATYHEDIDKADPMSKELCAVHCGNILVHSMGYGKSRNPDIDLQELISVKILELNESDLAETREYVQKLMDDTDIAF